MFDPRVRYANQRVRQQSLSSLFLAADHPCSGRHVRQPRD